MPFGIFIFTEEAEKGFVIKARYPQNLKIQDKIPKILKMSHFINKHRNFSNLTLGNSKFASLYTGSNINYYISLILKNEEDPIIFENILAFISKKIINNLSNDEYRDYLSNIFNIISLYPNFKEEQKLAIAYSDEIKRLIIFKLVEDAFIFKSDLDEWLKEKLGVDYIDLDSIINSLLTLGLVKKVIIEGFSDEFVFLIGDFFITRVPPPNIIELAMQEQIPKHLAISYISRVKNFFQNYSPTLEDADRISEILCDLDSYHLLELLCLSPASKNGIMEVSSEIKDLNTALNKLKSIGALEIIKDKQNNEYYFLITDLRIEKYFPEYILLKILKEYNNKSIPVLFLIEYLRNLKENYQKETEFLKKEEDFEDWEKIVKRIKKEEDRG